MAAFFGALVGLFGGVCLLGARTSRYKLLSWLSRFYISFIRGTPALVQILLIFYVLPRLLGISIHPMLAGIIAIGANSSAFTAEILRGSLHRIGKGQHEAGLALGLSPLAIWLKVLLPQIFMRAIPLLTSEFTMVVKATSLLSVVTIVELTRRGQQIMFETFRSVEVLLTVAALYFAICFLFSSISRFLEKRVARVFGSSGV